MATIIYKVVLIIYKGKKNITLELKDFFSLFFFLSF